MREKEKHTESERERVEYDEAIDEIHIFRFVQRWIDIFIEVYTTKTCLSGSLTVSESKNSIREVIEKYIDQKM